MCTRGAALWQLVSRCRSSGRTPARDPKAFLSAFSKHDVGGCVEQIRKILPQLFSVANDDDGELKRAQRYFEHFRNRWNRFIASNLRSRAP